MLKYKKLDFYYALIIQVQTLCNKQTVELQNEKNEPNHLAKSI